MSRKLRIGFLGLALACVTLTATSAPAQQNPPGVDPTHYWTYGPSYGGHPEFHQILARDQFFVGFTPIHLDSLLRFINPVRKNGSPILDPELHYTWWNIANKLPNFASAILTNQFGQYPINVYDLQFMLVPARKDNAIPGSPQANHYLCYRATGGPPPPGPYQLVDQWRTDVQQPGPLEYLCAPCWKDHAGVVYPAVDEITHLAMYPIAPTSPQFFPYIQDQFFSGLCDVRQEPIEYLLVPSLKQLIPTSTRSSTWGRLKSIYR